MWHFNERMLIEGSNLEAFLSRILRLMVICPTIMKYSIKIKWRKLWKIVLPLVMQGYVIRWHYIIIRRDAWLNDDSDADGNSYVWYWSGGNAGGGSTDVTMCQFCPRTMNEIFTRQISLRNLLQCLQLPLVLYILLYFIQIPAVSQFFLKYPLQLHTLWLLFSWWN